MPGIFFYRKQLGILQPRMNRPLTQAGWQLAKHPNKLLCVVEHSTPCWSARMTAALIA
jgi:hypothetical protein